MNDKEILGLLSGLLAVLSLLPYLRNILRGHTKPHAFSWLIWTMLAVVGFAASHSRGGGPGAWVSAVTGITNTAVLLLALRYGEKSITKSDWWCLFGAFMTMPLWLLTDSPVCSVILVVVIDAFGFWPTTRKSYLRPHEETLSLYLISAVKWAVSMFAIEHYSFVTVFGPASIMLLNLAQVTLVLVRRKQLAALLLVAALLPLKTMAEDLKPTQTKLATFAGGCFWCMQPQFDRTPGVIKTVVGYTGGHTENPTYDEVATRKTGHAEAIQITYDPAKVSYEKLLDVYWHSIDPLDPGGQFYDRGDDYRTVIFFHDDEQRKIAVESKRKLDESKIFPAPIVTQIQGAAKFYPAEDYHQQFYIKQANHYQRYHAATGRDEKLEKLWGK